ncbi:MAG: hypothetical protein ACXVLQ_03315 [Bacteriovorax sp.]
MRSANIFFYFLVFFSFSNAIANASEARPFTAEVKMEISRYSFDDKGAIKEAKKMFLENPATYLKGNAGVEYKKCKITKANTSVYKKTQMASDIINDYWNVLLTVVCTKIEKDADSIAGDRDINSSGRHMQKEHIDESPAGAGTASQGTAK